MKVRRVFVEKREGFDVEARQLKAELADFLGPRYPELRDLAGLRILNRYDAWGLGEDDFRRTGDLVFSEPQCDRVFFSLPLGEGDRYFGVEYLPGQYDQRSDSAEQCAELAVGIKPRIKSARFFIFRSGSIPVSEKALEAVKRYLINPVDSREASPELPSSLEDPELVPADVPVLEGFIRGADLEALAKRYGLAMGTADLEFCRAYFAAVKRDPTLAELRVLDTYWSDHCRHTTFTTSLDELDIADPALRHAGDLYEAARRELYGSAADTRPRSLMDMATIGAKLLKKRGLAGDVDESAEINACTVKIEAEFDDGSREPWLLLFKNETHNHPTEIEPFGGAATCLGGAIRDPLSGRAYVHQAMRISGGGDPRRSLSETLPGKLPQIRIARGAAAGYSSYGNQIGLATGQVAEFYHPGFLAKRMELGAVIAAVPAAWVRREEPAPGDLVLLAGGKTGRDGIGGATGSSKVHTGESVESAGAEVQKGNAVEERKLQRLFRNPRAAALIKRCNDFGAGGVSVAVGELAPGLDINLDALPKKYAGLDGIELAISESQERMAVVVAPADADAFTALAARENLDAVTVARVSAGEPRPREARLRMFWRGRAIVDLSRDFLDSRGAPRSAAARIPPPGADRRRGGKARSESADPETASLSPRVLLDNLEQELGSLRSGSRRGLQERFDGSVGAASVLFPWGGAEQGTPECGIAALLPSAEKRCRTASLMSFGYDPYLLEQDPYEGAKGSVREALAKFCCLGGDPWKARLSLQEYFERPENPESWGRTAAALLGALEAQLELGVPAIGGKDSMSGNYRDPGRGIDIAVPASLAAFAAGTAPAAGIRGGALSGAAGNRIVLLAQGGGEEGRGEWEVFRANMNALRELGAAGLVRAAYPVQAGGLAAALALMAFGNNTGVQAEAGAFRLIGEKTYQGSVLAEIAPAGGSGNGGGSGLFPEAARSILEGGASWIFAGLTLEDPVFRIASGSSGGGEDGAAELPLAALRRAYEGPLSRVYPQSSDSAPAEGEAGTAGRTDAFSEDGILALSACRAADRGEGRRPARIRAGSAGARGAGAPLALLPVFPGTNCEWDMERAFREAGARTRLLVFRNRGREDIAESTRELAAAIGEAQILALSGGFSAGDEPEGSGKFIANALRSPAIADAVSGLLEKRDGLILGICNGFQALIKLGLVPYGVYREAGPDMPTLTFNRIGRHVSRMVRTRVMSARSPWLSLEEPGALHIIPVSHGEGRLVISREEGEALFKTGQAAFCYADAEGRPAMGEPDNPNGSDFALEGISSPDGRVLGKMGHSERRGPYVHINIPGNKEQRIFQAGVAYFT
ncbi:MAG: phosphoribosylformylglycinamidine synthase [Treponema sp.]|jgi:phosphoribosylformylglycinamidine synthase|nr:phosphoribosylformylglycinamidine synthase [Treponema sp.]